ncbi:hypothetical protein L596_014619 [Steinernema carpocapsae]|uniref:ATP-dependent DNA helicase n=1 Tax=Steinernema carpocapsae TaxID=34508 RepID=A0A4U5NCF4_STECR|nr:hypothetical protein L596_014616 [Steinernema carpocapsae]TKR80562.1 hypothetical protein L596_014619 [Steinernema carpocapsae]
MLHGAVFDYIDRTIRACYLATDPESQQLFGGKCVLNSGDFKQLPPVAPGKGKYGEISANIASLPLFQKFKHIDLKKNIRVDANEVDFGRWLKYLGTGRNILENDYELAKIPPGCEVSTLKELIELFPKEALEDPVGKFDNI